MRTWSLPTCVFAIKRIAILGIPKPSFLAGSRIQLHFLITVFRVCARRDDAKLLVSDSQMQCDLVTIDPMSKIRRLAKAACLVVMGTKCRRRRILRGLASGYRINVSPAEHLSYLLGTAEPHLQKAILKFVRRGDTVYDVGANLGYFALSLSKQVGPSGKVAAFEPVSENLRLLRENIKDNQLKNIEVFDVAVSDGDGEARIRIPKNLAMASLVWHTQNSACIQQPTRTIAIDDLVQAGRLALPTFVKIDVEGAEALVVRGMHRTIAGAKPVLFIECSDSGREETWRLLSNCGYECRSAATSERVLTFDEYRHSDFLWIPSGQSGL